MSLSRIKNNQITDLTIQGGKLANNTVTAGKLEDDLTYGSNLTITGNLTVNGATTTVSTTTTTVEDAIMVLNSDGSGSFTNDVGMYLERGDNTSVFMGYDGSATQFALVETDSAGTVSAINITDYADLRLGGLTADDNITATGTVTGGTVTDGTASISSGAITGATNITGSGTITGGTLTDGTASISSGAITGATSGSFSTTLTATGNITGGNLITSALVSAATVTATGTVTGGTLTDGTASINSGAGTGFASLVVDNITIDGDDITTSGSALTINDAGGDMDVRIEGDSDTNLFVTDAGGDQVSIGTATQTTGVKFKVGTTDSAMLPIGTTAQRPTGVVGMLRFNTTTDTLEQYSSADGWEAVGAVTFTVIASETFDGDNSTVAFTLSDSQTTASCIISINGVVQLPTTAYGVSGTTLTFTEAPLSGDKIEVRKITTTTTVTNISSTSGGALVEAPNETEIDITGNLMPSANNTFSIGNATVGWTTVYAEATSAQYADLAEKYEADADYEPGTVVHFGGDKEVTECDTDHCTKVAGVVSTDPAYRMNDGLEAEHTAMVALTGRVPCKVSGPVAKGDMMVSAGNGRARAESDPKVGSVIGKSLENWEGGEGVIEVVVGKH